MKTFTTLLGLFLMPTLAFAGSFLQGLPDGSYKGKLRGQSKGNVHFMVKGYPGCDGCFILIALDSPDMFDKKVQLVAYSALPREDVMLNGQHTSRVYTLNPIGVTSTGELTIPNPDPSSVLTISKGVGTKDAEFTVSSAHTSNNFGINSSMAFIWTRESPYEITNPANGSYREPGGNQTKATMSQFTVGEQDSARTASISWVGTVRREGGSFLLKEKIPNVYTFNAISYLAEGEKVREMPNAIVMFLTRKGKTHLLMVNPVDSRDVSCYLLKGKNESDASDEVLTPVVYANYDPNLTPVTANLEYPGGPHSGMTTAEVQTLGAWSTNIQNELIRLDRQVSDMANASDSTIKKILYDRLKKIAGDTGMKPNDLLLRQSLYTGIYLVDIVDREMQKDATAGEVYQQVKILRQAMTMAKKYYRADQLYVDGLNQGRPDYRFNSQLVEFGMELSRFIIAQSNSMSVLDATASYGMMKWSLGVLNRKLYEDTRRTGFSDTIDYLNGRLKEFPESEQLSSDVEAVIRIMALKSLAKQTFDEIAQTSSSLVTPSN